jgi:peptide/nickel transport system permease protein
MPRLVRRLAWSIAVVWAVVTITFILDAVVPGDPARMVAGPQASPADVVRIGRTLGLDRPAPVRYALFLRRLVHFGPAAVNPDESTEHASCAVILPAGRASIHVDLGKSFQMREPVVDIVGPGLAHTIVLALAALLVELVIAVVSGTLAAAWPDSWLDRTVVNGSLLGLSAPTFLIAVGLQYVVAYRLRWLPLDGFGSTWLDHARSIVLPALTLGLYGAAYCARIVREEVAGLLAAPWVRTARSKGAGFARVVVVHALRNALLPLATVIGLDFGGLLGGAIVTETIFRWPGLGELSVRAALNRDGPVISACVVVTSIAVVAANLLTDAVYVWLDPRVSARRGPDTH